MSYCRFSCDNWRSDVYCYEGGDGYVTHVAGGRRAGEIPAVPGLTGVIAHNEGALAEWMAAHRAQMAAVEAAPIVPIGLPFDGKSFIDDTPAGMVARLLGLREAGYRVPQHAIDALRAEMEAAPEDD